MKLLDVEITYRQYLTVRRAIKVDAEGDETLVGLSRAESVTYLHLRQRHAPNNLPTDTGELLQYLALHECHVAALPDVRWFINALYESKQS
jgi:hypothetical protein